MLIEMVDGGIEEISNDFYDSPGCETCDYGSSYVSDFTVYMVSGDIKVHIDQMYDYAISEGYLMKLFLENVDSIKAMKEVDFYIWLKQEIEKELKGEYSWSNPEELEIDFVPHPIENNLNAARRLRRD